MVTTKKVSYGIRMPSDFFYRINGYISDLFNGITGNFAKKHVPDFIPKFTRRFNRLVLMAS
jgi:hypothetical protein